MRGTSWRHATQNRGFLVYSNVSMRPPALVAALAVLCALPAHADDWDDVAPLVVKPKQKAPAKKPEPKKPALDALDDEVAPLTPVAKPKPVVAAPQLLLKLNEGVSDATWTLDGKERGAVPAGAVDVPAGEHTVTVRAPGFEDYTERVKATPGATVTVAATLPRTPGILSLTVSPSDAEVLVDGAKVEGNLKRYPLPAGDHILTVRRKGMEGYEEVIAIVAGGQKQLTVKLKPLAAVRGAGDRPEPRKLTPTVAEPSPMDPVVAEAEVDAPREPAWYQRWYVWAGVAAVAAGATAAVVVATTPGPPPATSVVCNGKCDAVLNAPGGAAAVRF